MIRRFVDDDAGYRSWLREHPGGYVLNAYPHGSSTTLVLHRAACGTVNRPLGAGRHWTSQGGKACSTVRAELETWAKRERGRGVEPHARCCGDDDGQGVPASPSRPRTQKGETAAPVDSIRCPRLFELAYGCRLYGQITSYDATLVVLRALGAIDPLDPIHQAALFHWLNTWGCRQFSKEHHASTAAMSLAGWASAWLPRLPGPEQHLTDLSAEEIDVCAGAYGSLVGAEASRRALPGGRKSRVNYGPTGAAKTLFALRPNVFPPWDEPVRVERGWSGDEASFGLYLRETASHLRCLAGEAGVRVAELPKLVGRPDSPPPKLLDEYYWITVTRRCTPPTAEEIALWAHWAESIG